MSTLILDSHWLYTKCAHIKVAAEPCFVSELTLHHYDNNLIHGERVVNHLWYLYLTRSLELKNIV